MVNIVCECLSMMQQAAGLKTAHDDKLLFASRLKSYKWKFSFSLCPKPFETLAENSSNFQLIEFPAHRQDPETHLNRIQH